MSQNVKMSAWKQVNNMFVSEIENIISNDAKFDKLYEFGIIATPPLVSAAIARHAFLFPERYMQVSVYTLKQDSENYNEFMIKQELMEEQRLESLSNKLKLQLLEKINSETKYNKSIDSTKNELEKFGLQDITTRVEYQNTSKNLKYKTEIQKLDDEVKINHQDYYLVKYNDKLIFDKIAKFEKAVIRQKRTNSRRS